MSLLISTYPSVNQPKIFKFRSRCDIKVCNPLPFYFFPSSSHFLSLLFCSVLQPFGQQGTTPESTFTTDDLPMAGTRSLSLLYIIHFLTMTNVFVLCIITLSFLCRSNATILDIHFVALESILQVLRIAI